MSSKRGRGTGGRGRRNRDFKETKSDKDSKTDPCDDTPMMKCFRGFQNELDSRNDRHERIFKISRDITIESKRLIFLLQRVIGSDNPDQILKEAEHKIQELNSTHFLEIAKELDGQDPYQFLRAYTNGLQEYIEAVTFYYYLKENKLVNCEKVTHPLVFTVNDSIQPIVDLAKDQGEKSNKSPTSTLQISTEDTVETGKTLIEYKTDSEKKEQPVIVNSDQQTRQISVHVPQSEYMLGVADFTGELMRMAINSVGVGDLETPKLVANMLRVIHNAFSLFEHTSRDLRMKTNVLRQSMQKVENACYALTVRGSEVPKHMLKDVFTTASYSGDNYSMEENSTSKEIYD